MSAPGSSSLLLALIFSALCCASCTVLLDREHDQCHTSEDCQSLALGAVCTQSGICEQLVEAAPLAAQVCRGDADCTSDAWSVCRTGSCRSLRPAGCVALSSASKGSLRDRLPLAVLVPAAELNPDAHGPNLAAASVAIDELRSGFDDLGEPYPSIVAVACDEDDAAAQALLIDAGVRLFIGPMQLAATESTRVALNGGAVLFSPYADDPQLETPPSPPTSSIVSCSPNRSQSKASLLSATHFIQEELRRRSLTAQTSVTVLPLSDAESALGYEALFEKKDLDSAAVRGLRYTNVPPGQGLVTELQRAHVVPDLLVAASTVEDWSATIAAVDDSATFAGRPYPFYLLAQKQEVISQLSSQVNGSDHPVYQRAMGLDYALSPSNVRAHDSFFQEFTQENDPAIFQPGLDYVYDCVYLATYAAVAGLFRYSIATSDLSPVAVLVGLRALSDGGRTLATGAADISKVLREIRDRRGFDASVSLLGASGDFDLLGSLSVQEIARAPEAQYVRPNARDQQLYCTDPKLGFVDTTVRFPSSGAAPAPDAGDRVSCLVEAAQ